MKFNPDVCKTPQMDRKEAAAEYTTLFVFEDDLNTDGKNDVYVAVRQGKNTFCGNIPEEEIVKGLVQKFGSYDNKKRNGNGVTLIGSMWRATISRGKNSTTIETRVADPVSFSPEMTLEIKHLRGRQLKYLDPVAIKNDTQTYIVFGINYFNALTYDGNRKISANYDNIKLNLVPMDVFMSGQKLDLSKHVKVVFLKDIKAVMNRGAFSQLYRAKPQK